MFFFNSVLLGIGLAMDAFSVSLASGLNHPEMGKARALSIAGVFAFFQFLMPMIGWALVHTATTLFTSLQPVIPWIALVILAIVGGKMIRDGLKEEREGEKEVLSGKALFMMGVATSLDALSVGFTISDHSAGMAVAASLIISAVTLAVCLLGIRLGRIFGMKLAGKASILGGVILIGIGLEIAISSLL